MSEREDKRVEGEDETQENDDRIGGRSAPITGGGPPRSEARCSSCGVALGRPHRDGCEYA